MTVNSQVIKLYAQSEKRVVPTKVSTFSVTQKNGIEGDFHSEGDRQICFIFEGTQKSLDLLKNQGVCTQRFHSNMVISGELSKDINEGNALIINGCKIKITQIGRKCHNICSLKNCPLINEVIFGKFLNDGSFSVNDEVIYER